MFGCYRKGDANDPQIYTAAIAATLADYSERVIAYVTDFRTGLPSNHTFLPSVAEVRLACDKAQRFFAARDALEDKGWKWNDQLGKWEQSNAL